jgi:hypothetical protein
MSEPTLESLARRLDELERRLNDKKSSTIPPAKGWRSVVGISERTEFSRLMQAEMDAARETDRQAAEAENPT